MQVNIEVTPVFRLSLERQSCLAMNYIFCIFLFTFQKVFTSHGTLIFHSTFSSLRWARIFWCPTQALCRGWGKMSGGHSSSRSRYLPRSGTMELPSVKLSRIVSKSDVLFLLPIDFHSFPLSSSSSLPLPSLLPFLPPALDEIGLSASDRIILSFPPCSEEELTLKKMKTLWRVSLKLQSPQSHCSTGSMVMFAVFLCHAPRASNSWLGMDWPRMWAPLTSQRTNLSSYTSGQR